MSLSLVTYYCSKIPLFNKKCLLWSNVGYTCPISDSRWELGVVFHNKRITFQTTVNYSNWDQRFETHNLIKQWAITHFNQNDSNSLYWI